MNAAIRPGPAAIGNAFLDVFFPRCCLHCGDAVDDGPTRHLCPACFQRLRWASGACCTTCGHPFPGRVDAGHQCPHCEQLVPAFAAGRTAVLLRGPARTLIHALKYHHALHALEDVVAIMRHCPGYADYVGDAALVPVPLHPRKQRERGYNQSRLLAVCAAQAAGRDPRVAEVLVRRVDTPSQTAFSRAHRQANLKNAFALAGRADITPGQRYLIVDDVFTTGSTLNACAAVLRRAGATRIDVLTFGHG